MATKFLNVSIFNLVLFIQATSKTFVDNEIFYLIFTIW